MICVCFNSPILSCVCFNSFACSLPNFLCFANTLRHFKLRVYSYTRDFLPTVIRFVSIHRFLNTLQFSFSKLFDVPHIHVPPPVGDTHFQLPNMYSAALVHIMKHMYSKHVLTSTAGFFVLCWFSIPPHIHCQTSYVLLTNGDISSCVLYSPTPTRAFPQTLIRFVNIHSFLNTFQFSFSGLFDVPHILSRVTHTLCVQSSSCTCSAKHVLVIRTQIAVTVCGSIATWVYDSYK